MRRLSLGLVPTPDCEYETNDMIKDIHAHQAPNPRSQPFRREASELWFKRVISELSGRSLSC